MASISLNRWNTVTLPAIDALARTGGQALSAAAADQAMIERFYCGLTASLVAEFQAYCRELHDQSVALYMRRMSFGFGKQ